MTDPLVLPRIQPLQTGYRDIPLHLQNETNLLDFTSFSVTTVFAPISVHP